MNIYQKLIEVRMAVPYLQKANQGLQFKYVSSSDALSALKGKMDELGLLLVPSVVKNEVRDHTTKKGDHNYFTILDMTFTWINADKPTEQIVSSWTGQGLDTGEKGVGKALTYAEKYFILKFFNIPTDKDDPDSFQKKVESKSHKEPATEDQINQIRVALSETVLEVDGFLKTANLKSFNEFTQDRVAATLKYLSGLERREVDND